MPKEYARATRIAEQIRRDLSELIRVELKDPRISLVTLTDVEVSADYAHAKVYFTTLADAEHLPEITAGLRRASGFLRHELGRRIHIHHLPELHFIYDPSVERGTRLSRLIDEAVQDHER
jgi:ribosome-binding factor A